MKINITWGLGSGTTKLSSFDAALFDAGLANFNLIKLSSVIPLNTAIQLKKVNYNNKYIGYKLYAVISSLNITKNMKEGFVGLGWVNDPEKGGVFIESNSTNKKQIQNDIENALNEMKKSRNIIGDNNHKIVRILPSENYSCGIVCAVYKIEDW